MLIIEKLQEVNEKEVKILENENIGKVFWNNRGKIEGKYSDGDLRIKLNNEDFKGNEEVYLKVRKEYIKEV